MLTCSSEKTAGALYGDRPAQDFEGERTRVQRETNTRSREAKIIINHDRQHLHICRGEAERRSSQTRTRVTSRPCTHKSVPDGIHTGLVLRSNNQQINNTSLCHRRMRSPHRPTNRTEENSRGLTDNKKHKKTVVYRGHKAQLSRHRSGRCCSLPPPRSTSSALQDQRYTLICSLRSHRYQPSNLAEHPFQKHSPPT